jgi:signal transduction histidine kinase
MQTVYELGAEAQTERAVALASEACSQLQAEYGKVTRTSSDDLSPAGMGALLNAVLVGMPGIEGGFWHDSRGSVAYAYPTHQGRLRKTDLPSTERRRIESLVRSSLLGVEPAMELRQGISENVVIIARPAAAGTAALGVWTMARVPVAAGRAYDQVTQGLGLLLAFAMGSGLWLSYSFYRWTYSFGRVEGELCRAEGVALNEIPWTGDAELDRIVAALNGFRERLADAQTHAAELRTSLERQERYAALGRMAASVAHEVRNPIAAMRLKAENALVQPERREAALTFMLREVDRLNGIVKTLLSRAEPVRVRMQDVSLRDWLASRAASFSDRCTARQIGLRPVSNVASWLFDPDAVGRALDNIVDNALDHTPVGGAIEVRAESRGDPPSLFIRVSDNGPGVAPDLRDRVFEPFVSGRPDGIGLGLALARDVALAHSGDLRLLPRARGACFELEIPWRAS